MRHIAVIGMHYSGANALAYALGALPGCANVGESNVIASDPLNGICNVCREACTVLTPAFLQGLRNNPSAWYQKLASHFAADTLISMERDADALKARTLDVDVIYCFRPPLAAYHSHETARAPRRFELAAFLWKWAHYYGLAHYEFPSTGRKLWVDFSTLVQNPAANLEALCGKLDLPFDARALEYWKEPQHAVGGGTKTDALFRQKQFDALRWSARPEPEISDEQRVCFAEHGPALGMYEFMRKQAAQ